MKAMLLPSSNPRKGHSVSSASGHIGLQVHPTESMNFGPDSFFQKVETEGQELVETTRNESPNVLL